MTAIIFQRGSKNILAFRPERSEKAKPPTDRRDGSRNGVEHLRYLYEEVYCDRGNAELFIKDHKNGLKSGRASCHKATANQFRLFLHSSAYMLMHALRDKLPDGAQLAHAQFDTIRMRLLKCAARVEVSTRCILFHLPLNFPFKDIYQRLCCLWVQLRT